MKLNHYRVVDWQRTIQPETDMLAEPHFLATPRQEKLKSALLIRTDENAGSGGTGMNHIFRVSAVSG